MVASTMEIDLCSQIEKKELRFVNKNYFLHDLKVSDMKNNLVSDFSGSLLRFEQTSNGLTSLGGRSYFR